MPYPPTYQKVNPADQPILFLALTSPTLPLYDAGRVRRDADRRSASPRSTASRRCRSTARRSTPCASSSTRARSPRRGIGIDEVARAIAERQRQPAHRHPLGPGSGVHDPGRRAAHRRGRIPADRRRLPQRQAGAPRGPRHGLSTASRTTRPPPGSSRTSAPSCWRSSASRAPTPSRSRAAVKALLPIFEQQLPASVTLNGALRPLDVDPRLRQRRQVHPARDAGPGRAGHLRLPAQPLRDHHPVSRHADVDRRHLRRACTSSTTASTTSR